MNTQKISFDLISQKRVSDEAVTQVLALIDSGQLRIGDQLPGERQLTEQMGISRSAVRDAIRILETQGILEVRAGKGTFVTGHTHIAGLPARWANWLLEHQVEVFNLLEVRSALEPLAAQGAAEKATAEAVRTMWELCDSIDQCILANDIEGAAEYDIQFHEVISASTGNDFLIELNKTINVSLIENRYVYYSLQGAVVQSNSEHRRVVSAIEAHDPKSAKTTMYQHIQNSRKKTRAFIAYLDASQEKAGQEIAEAKE